jgi:hypothetical protein
VRRTVCALAGFIACAGPAAAGPGVASAASDGVTFDQNSPAGREYAIPLEQARRQYGATKRKPRHSSTQESSPAAGFGPGGSPPLFGEGITPASKARSSQRPDRKGTPARPTSESASASRPAAAVQAAGETGSGMALGIGVGGAALLLGLGMGVVVRLRTRTG